MTESLFMIKNIQASFTDKCSLKAARSSNHKHTSMEGGRRGGCITVTFSVCRAMSL